MLQVKTYIAPSRIEGIGLFASGFIAEGTLIWKFTPGLDLVFTPEEYAAWNQREEFAQLVKFIYKSTESGNYILCCDNARFMNHLTGPNALDLPGEPEGITIAKRDILPDEEITCDYSLFDAEYALYGAKLNVLAN